jgi:hypothetical protein
MGLGEKDQLCSLLIHRTAKALQLVSGLRLEGNISQLLYCLLQLGAELRAFLHPLKRGMMALQRILDNLYRLALTLRQLLELLGVLLLLLQHDLIRLVRLLCLLDQLLDDLLALASLLNNIVHVNFSSSVWLGLS